MPISVTPGRKPSPQCVKNRWKIALHQFHPNLHVYLKIVVFCTIFLSYLYFRNIWTYWMDFSTFYAFQLCFRRSILIPLFACFILSHPVYFGAGFEFGNYLNLIIIMNYNFAGISFEALLLQLEGGPLKNKQISNCRHFKSFLYFFFKLSPFPLN